MAMEGKWRWGIIPHRGTFQVEVEMLTILIAAACLAHGAPTQSFLARDILGNMIDLGPAASTCGVFPVVASAPISALDDVSNARRAMLEGGHVVLIFGDPAADASSVRTWVHRFAADLPVVLDPTGEVRSSLPVTRCGHPEAGEHPRTPASSFVAGP